MTEVFKIKALTCFERLWPKMIISIIVQEVKFKLII